MTDKDTSLSLGEHFTQFVADQVKEGRYPNTSAVIRAALQLLEHREAKMTALRDALIEGEESGAATPLAVSGRNRKLRLRTRVYTFHARLGPG